MRIISLAPLTVAELAPPEFVTCAAQAGFSHVALRLMDGSPTAPGSPSLVKGQAMLRETELRLRTEGVAVSDIEVVVLDDQTRVADCRPALETGARLGARRLVTVIKDPDVARATGTFAALCEMAGEYGVTVCLEFLPYSATRTLGAACDLIRAAAASNAGVLIDALHLHRSGGGAADVARCPPLWVSCLQLCDAPAEPPEDEAEMIRQSRQERLYPGEGAIDLTGIVAAAPADVPLSIEAPHVERSRREGAVAHAAQARRRVIELLERSGAPGPE